MLDPSPRPASRSNYRPEVAKAFVRDMHLYFAEKNGHRADAIALRQLHALTERYSGWLRLTDVKEIFLQMMDQS